MTSPATALVRATVLSVAVVALGGCTIGQRLADIGKPPDLAPIQNVQAPPKPRSLSVRLPDNNAVPSNSNSLWRVGAKAFFRDQRASQIGDILTVNIDISDSAQIANQTKRTRDNSEKADLTNFLGFESKLGTVLPSAVSPSSLAGFGSGSSHTGTGEVDRSEDIKLKVAAIVVDVLPNGNLVIQGRQEVRVNFEVRELLIAGIVRPQDISSDNTIRHTQIAEARISYGGRGQLTDVQQPRYGQQLYDILFPF